MKNKSNTITMQKAIIDYRSLIKEAILKKLWFKAKALDLWLSPYELQEGWLEGKYLFPVSYWILQNPNIYLEQFSKKMYNEQLLYDYAHKRFQVYVQKSELNTLK